MIVVVQEYGASIGKRSNCLVIKNGDGEKEISSDQVTELHVFPACSISSDAIRLCMDKDIWVVFLNKYGEPTGEVAPFAGGSAPIYKRNQLLLTHRREGVELAKDFLSRKIENRIRQLKKIRRNKRKAETLLVIDESIEKMEEQLTKIRKLCGTDMDTVRATLQGFEGNAGKAYFEAVSYLLPEEMQFTKHQRNADDIYNSVLNYLYGILYAKIKKMAYKCRLDPYIGIMHVDSYNKPTFVYDFIEGQRIVCEELAFGICSHSEITWDDVEERTPQGLRFSEAAKKRLISEFYTALNETCYFKKKQVTVERRMYSEMLEVAQKIGGLDTEMLAAG